MNNNIIELLPGGQSEQAVLLLSIQEVARMVSIQPRTLWRGVSAGWFPSPRLRRHKMARWAAEDIEQWIAGGCKPCA